MHVQKKEEKGLVCEFQVIVPKDEVAKRVNAFIEKRSQTFRMDGFRPGKVPADVVRKHIGSQARETVIDEFIQESTRKIIDEHKLRPALDPVFRIDKDEEFADLEFGLTVENFPVIEMKDFKQIKVDRLIHKVDVADVDADVAIWCERIPEYVDAPKGAAAKDGDRIIFDIETHVNGKLNKDYTGTENIFIVGKSQMGFKEVDDAFDGKKAGDTFEVSTRFPADFEDSRVAGRDVVFKMTIKSILNPQNSKADDAFAARIGFKDIAAFKNEREQEIQRERNQLIMFYHKRRVLDALAEQYSFELPPKMVEQEFEGIWSKFQEEFEQGKAEGSLSDEELKKPMDEYRKEYEGIAQRRVRLGILIADIAHKNNVRVTDQKMAELVWQEANRFPPEQRAAAMDFYRRNAQARERLRSPALEEMVIEFILERATIKDVPLTYPELKKHISEVLPGFDDGEDERSASSEKKTAKKAKK